MAPKSQMSHDFVVVCFALRRDAAESSPWFLPSQNFFCMGEKVNKKVLGFSGYKNDTWYFVYSTPTKIQSARMFVTSVHLKLTSAASL